MKNLKFRALPENNSTLRLGSRKASIPVNTLNLYIAAIRLAAQDPFHAPTKSALSIASGIHLARPAFKQRAYRQLIKTLRLRERRIVHKQRIWREVCDVHNAAVKVINAGVRFSRRNVTAEMERPSVFHGRLARAYFAWIEDRVRLGGFRIVKPKHAPLDVRAYWALNSKPKPKRTPEGALRFILPDFQRQE